MKPFIYLILLLLAISCNNNHNKSENKNSVPVIEQETLFKTNATVLSVSEELIMPSDYLTTAMTVKTENNDTLVFLEMNALEELVGTDINIQYKLWKIKDLILCSNCTKFREDIQLYDITAIISSIKKEKLKLLKYEEDPWITPASTYKMENQIGESNQYFSNDNELIADSINMKNQFLDYVIATIVRPELINLKSKDSLIYRHNK